ncbi:hypothetical protein FB45DRAFT_826272 [Roridomyces roridus]|uniref:DUF6534 domain-containing protein n=1 Tax=Roridomyces roridus TaxID=1738132 RepID=A0AAD7C8U3_9AGAR|nr:hypothetical protein FB45DRAFT_826272 [Roridomyces roridus]
MHDKIIGSLLIASWVDTALYFLELLHAYRYFVAFPRDLLFVKVILVLCCLVDAVCVAGNYGGVYLYAVTHWGDEEYIQDQSWPIYVYVMATSFTAFLVQNYLMYRCFRASKSILTTLLLFLIATTALVGAIVTTVIVVNHRIYSQRHAVQKPVIIWLVASAFADIFISLTLVWQLRSMKPPFKETQSVIHRLIRTALQTGAVTATFATIVLILYLIDEDSNVTVGVGFVLGRVYTLTMLYNLHGRPRIQSGVNGNGAMGMSGGGEGMETTGGVVSAVVFRDESEMTEAGTQQMDGELETPGAFDSISHRK